MSLYTLSDKFETVSVLSLACSGSISKWVPNLEMQDLATTKYLMINHYNIIRVDIIYLLSDCESELAELYFGSQKRKMLWYWHCYPVSLHLACKLLFGLLLLVIFFCVNANMIQNSLHRQEIIKSVDKVSCHFKYPGQKIYEFIISLEWSCESISPNQKQKLFKGH